MHKPLGFTLDPALECPLYRQLFDLVVARIRSGTFPARYRLPPSRDLARELGTHRNTVVRAYAGPRGRRLRRLTVGRGTFVMDQPGPATPEVVSERGSLPWPSLVGHALQAESLGRSERLGTGPATADAINLSRMQPSPDLLPHELFRRCIDHVLRTQGHRALGYAPREGVPRLRSPRRRGPGAAGRARRAPRTWSSPPAASRRSTSSRARS